VKGEVEDAGLLFYSDYFTLPGIGGDKTIRGNENYRIHGRYLKFERIEIVRYDLHKEWPRSSDYYNSKSKIRAYKHFLEFYGFEISKSDHQKVQQLIDDEEKKVEQESLKESYSDNFSEIQESINKLRKEKVDNINQKLSYFIANSHPVFSSVSAIIELKMDELKKISGECHISGMYGLNSSPAKSSKERCEYAVSQKEIAMNKFVPLANSIDSLLSLTKNTINSSYRVKKKYKNTSGTQQKLYDIYLVIKDDMLSSIKVKNDLENSINRLADVIKISDKVLELYNRDCKDLIKSVKKVKSTNEKLKLLLNR